MVEKMRPLNGTDPIPPAEDTSRVCEAVESSAQSVKKFQVLAHPIREKIITGMIEILAPVETKNRGRWYAGRAEIGKWKLDTLDTLRGNVKYDDEEGVDETEEALLLRQLTEAISKEFRIHSPDLFTPIREVFKRTMSTMESSFDSYTEAQGHREISKTTGKVRQGSVRSTGGVGEGGRSTALVVKTLF